MEYKGVCDIGLKRRVNQDAIFMAAKGETGLFCVADGLGGHSHGERASGEIVCRLAEWWKNFRDEDYADGFLGMMFALNQVLVKANENIYRMSDEGEICGSTAVVLFICGGRYGVLSAGDSRAYLCRRFRVKQVTVDEVWENQIDLFVSEEEKRLHPNRGKLTNAIGIGKEARITSTTNSIRKGAVFMLCSDGLYKMMAEHALYGYLKKCRRSSLDVIADRMMKKVYDGGATDNISVVLIKV